MAALAGRITELIPPGQLVVGLSGGPDSTLALLVAVAVRTADPRYHLLAVHCIHGLDASDDFWLRHCRALCADLAVELKTPRLDIRYGPRLSPEAVSRDERYGALLAARQGPGALILGHHADDEIEGLLLALKRGSGPRGLAAMPEYTADPRTPIVRPFLKLHKREIEDLLEALGYTYLYDESNAGLNFERNFLRLEILPRLYGRFPGMGQAILRSGRLCALEHELAAREVRACLGRALRDNRLHTGDLPQDDPPLLTAVLHAFMGHFLPLPPPLTQVEALAKILALGPDQQAVVKVGPVEFRRYGADLFAISPRQAPDPEVVELAAGQSLRGGDYGYRVLPAKPGEKGAFAGQEPWQLDFVRPLSLKVAVPGRAHRQSLKHLFQALMVPPWERPALPLVRGDDGRPLAVGDRLGLCAPEEPGPWWRLEIQPLKPE